MATERDSGLQGHRFLPALCLLLLVGQCTSTLAVTRYVSPTGGDSSPYTTWGAAAHRIVDAIDVAQAGDVVLVTNGTYNTGLATFSERVSSRIKIEKAITVKSVNGPEYTCIVGGGDFNFTSNSVRCVYMAHDDAQLIGFSITNGHTETSTDVRRSAGAGVMCEGGLIANCIISENAAAVDGGGVYLSSTGTLRNCVVEGNWGLDNGAGVYCYNGGLVQNCTIRGNTAGAQGGGIYCDGGGVVQNSIVHSNSVSGSVNNWVNAGPTSYAYTCTMPLPAGEGNFSDDPMFADNGTFRLHWQSPCVDTGSTQDWMIAGTDVDGRARIVNGKVDVGAYELPLYQVTAAAGVYGAIAPSGTFEVAHGASTSLVLTADEHYHVADIKVNGSSVGATNLYVLQSVTNDKAIVATFTIDTFDLVVVTPLGTASPAVGTNNYDYGTTVTCSVVDSPLVSALTNYQCKGWDGSGSVPTAGGGTNVVVVMTNTSAITWRWATNYYLEVAVTNGTSDPPTGWYQVDTNMTITAVPTAGYHFVRWTGDVVSVTNPVDLTMDTPHSVTGIYEINTYTLTPTAGVHGSISPSVPVQITHGASTSFTFTADENYHVYDVLVDGQSVGRPDEYVIAFATNSHTIAVVFTNTYELVVASAYGGPEPAGTHDYVNGTNLDCKLLGSPMTDGVLATQYLCTGWVGTGSFDPASGTSTIVNLTITNNSTITWQWQTNYYFDALAGSNGGINVDAGWYPNGTSVTISATASSHYHFVGWTGDFVTNKSSLVVTMDQPYAVMANFAIDTFTISATASVYGAISPSGTIEVVYGSSNVFTITPDTNCSVTNVVVDGTPIGPTNSYAFGFVTNNHTIEALFELNSYAIFATAGVYGAISPSGTVTVLHNGTTNFQIDAVTQDYHIASIVVNAVTNNYADNSFESTNYVWTAITDDGSISAFFAFDTYRLIVTNQFGTAVPDGTNSYAVKTVVTNAVTDSPVYVGSRATQYVCKGWTGTGSFSPSNGLGTNAVVTITNNSTLTWGWITNHFLTISTNGNGNVDLPSGWYPSGTSITITATGIQGTLFDGWTGDIESTNSAITVTNDKPYSLIANFTYKTYYVSPTGMHVAPYTNWSTAATNIQSAVDQAQAGQRVLVTNGRYIVSTPITTTNGVFIQSVNGPEPTIVEARRASRCFTLVRPGDILDGFTVRGGWAANGGGIECSAGGVVRNCIISGNSADNGGGIYLSSASKVENCIIVDNSARQGGGIHFGNGGEAWNCTVVGNTVTYRGGGIYGADFFSTRVVRNCIIYGNIQRSDSSGTNYFLFSPGWSSQYTCTTPAISGTGNITDTPVLTAAYRSQGSSPCIDAGTDLGAPITDFDGEARWDHPQHGDVISTVDIGADEFVDTDLDSLADSWEIDGIGNITNSDGMTDTDGDGLSDIVEYANGTSPGRIDTDSDTLNDCWETLFALDPLTTTGALWGAAFTHQDSCVTTGESFDVWVSGNYAYVADGAAGLQVIDVRVSTNCVQVGGYDTAGAAYGVFARGTYAYVADGSKGLQVIDVSDPANCTRVGGYDTDGEARRVRLDGDFAYVADGNSGLQVINIADPTNCTLADRLDTVDARGLCVSNGVAYIADGANGLRIINISDPSNCVEIGSHDIGDARGVVVVDSLAYVADFNSGLQVVDVADPSNTVSTGACYVITARDVAINGSYAYLAGTWGLSVIDVSVPSYCFHAGRYMAASEGYGLHVIDDLAYLVDGGGRWPWLVCCPRPGTGQ